MSDEQTYTQADLDAAVRKALADAAGAGKAASQTVAGAIGAERAAVQTLKDAGQAAKIFYHLYVCRFTACLKAANPLSGSWHQRGVHLASSTPRTDIKCPGCGEPMVIGRNGLTADGKPHPDGQITEDRDGNAVLHGEPIIQEAPGQEDQTAQIEKENAQ